MAAKFVFTLSILSFLFRRLSAAETYVSDNNLKSKLFPNVEITLANDYDRTIYFMCKNTDKDNTLHPLDAGQTYRFNFTQLDVHYAYKKNSLAGGVPNEVVLLIHKLAFIWVPLGVQHAIKGKIALVTGGDSGIGRAVCHCFALEGATVAFTYVKAQEEKDAEETVGILKKAKSGDAKDPIAIAADLGFDENCKKVVDEVVKAYGRIDILVNNAAEQYESNSVEEIDEARLLRVLRTNICSYFFLTRHGLKYMKEGSSIINTTSINAYKGHAKLLDYTATKGAIVAFTRGLALQLVNKGIRVNGVAPGPIWTPLIPASFTKEECASFGKDVPMQRAAHPIEVAPCYVFLASSPDSSYIFRPSPPP
nr:glucose and ribitol dehydrogenase-like [Ipomoea batatas]